MTVSGLKLTEFPLLPFPIFAARISKQFVLGLGHNHAITEKNRKCFS